MFIRKKLFAPGAGLVLLLGAALTACDPTEQAALPAAITTATPAAVAVVDTPTAEPAPPTTAPEPPPPATDTPVPLPTSTPEPPTLEPPTATAVPTDTPVPLPTDTPVPAPPPPTETPVPLPPTEAPPTVAAQPPAQPVEGAYSQVVNGVYYDAYIPAATKKKQFYHYTCEFDAAWVVLKTYGVDTTLEDQLAIVGTDDRIEPRYEETADGVVIYGGDIFNYYSGHVNDNFLSRATGQAFTKLFQHYGFPVTPVRDRESLEAALNRGELVWIKTTADFKPGRPATWVTPEGETLQTVLGNDHAVVVMGYNEEGALIRDVLGPTSTNWEREYEYVVPWVKFLDAWGQQQNDGLAVAGPK
jgi:hypothetical protein